MLALPTLATTTLSCLLGAAVAANTELYRRAGLYECPELCSIAGPHASNWTRFTSNDDLKWCKNDTMLLNLQVSIPLSDDKAHSVFQACISSRADEVESLLKKRHISVSDDSILHVRSNVSFVQSSTQSTVSSFANDAGLAIKELQAKYLDVPNTDTNQTVYFAKHGDSVVGVYVGGDVHKKSIAATLMQRLQEHVASGKDLAQTILLQMCEDGRNADSLAGVAVDGRGGLDSVFAVQKFVSTWADGRCVSEVDGPTSAETIKVAHVRTAVLPRDAAMIAGRSESEIGFSIGSRPGSQLDRRGDCKVTQVISGDSCASLASKCNLSQADFAKLHSQKDFCGSLLPGQWVCCTSGNLPDVQPKANKDGSCFSFKVTGKDDCAKIAASHAIKVEDINKFNLRTWGFAGCNSLWPDMLICLSPGDPPLPAPVANAKCGPQVPGTKQPPKGTSIADLNPCPLKACCNVWGQCGTTEGFCIDESLGRPGTSKPGKNGCISNCGMDIVNNKTAPAQQMTVGYYEAWNYNRSCLHMNITQMSKSISHIHFAFVDVTAGFHISTAQVQDQWNKFKGMTGHHKVAAFGGWAASTEPTSYWIFREGMKPGNREILATNMANFIISNNMDGIDIDWEYPGAKDIPGIPSADPFDGNAYVELLKLLRKKLGTGKTISIAAPGSYWYLQTFPIEEISKIVDYIVFMTYDLHGQWDYGQKWAMPGCDGVSCLRSHINMTETMNSLAMITKAGVPSNKIVVGVSSYGRSFQMTKPGCSGPQCGFTGPESTAEKGRCTGSSGYISNAEIDEIIQRGNLSDKRTAGQIQQFTDDTETQILIYNNTQWVAYMDEGNKEARKQKWANLNFAGTTDWAVDLATFTPGDNNTECWRSKHCRSPGATSTEQNNTMRWNELCSDAAWDAAISHYKSAKNNSDEGFTRIISNFFHGTSNMDCGVLSTENGCHSFQPCLQGEDTAPAGTFILNGFVSMSDFYSNIYEGVEDSQQSLEVNGVLENFVNTFAPEPKEPVALKVVLDIVSFGLSAATGPFFNNFLRNTPWGKANKDSSDNMKDTLRAVITFSFASSKDMIGFDAAIDMLHKTITDGKLLGAKAVARLDFEDRMTKLFYAMLIPYLWRLKGWNPVLVDTQSNCDSTDDIAVIPDDTNKVCIDGKRYYMLRPDGDATECSSGSSAQWGMGCRFNKLTNMDGFSKLTGNGDWAGLKMEDLASSILARRKVNWGNPTEAGQYPDYTNSDHFDKMWDWINNDNMIQAPGLIDIPVCGVNEIINNWKTTSNNYYSWPCNKP